MRNRRAGKEVLNPFDRLRFHIEQYTEDLVRSGCSPEEARRRARMEFGGIDTVKQDCREPRGLAMFDALEREYRFAARQLWRNPGFTGTVVLTLALAIGANTAIFSMVNALLLKDLPYAHPERIGEGRIASFECDTVITTFPFPAPWRSR
jgi:hypothetical protein